MSDTDAAAPPLGDGNGAGNDDRNDFLDALSLRLFGEGEQSGVKRERADSPVESEAGHESGGGGGGDSPVTNGKQSSRRSCRRRSMVQEMVADGTALRLADMSEESRAQLLSEQEMVIAMSAQRKAARDQEEAMRGRLGAAAGRVSSGPWQ
jgi:hypothetical protein